MSIGGSRRPRLLIQPPGIAALFELGDSVIGDRKSFLFGQSFFQTANDLRERLSAKAIASRSTSPLVMDQKEHIENNIASHYILRAFREGVATAGRRGVIECAAFHCESDLG